MTDKFPARSKMIDVYLADIGHKLASDELEQAGDAAVLLPYIASALEHPSLSTSGDEYRAWCLRWAVPPPVESEVNEWRSRAAAHMEGFDNGVPAAALRIFRLKRFKREIPSPNIPEAHEEGSPRSTAVDRLMQATRTWYAQVGRHSDLVQENLARLGVLR